MQGMHGDAVWDRAGGFGEGFAPGVVAFVRDADPIDRAEHDGFSRTEQYDAARAQGILDFPRRRVSHGTAERRCRVREKEGDAERSVRGGRDS